MRPSRLVSAAFGLLMVAAAAVEAAGPGLIAAMAAMLAVVFGVYLRAAATAAVLAAACAVGLSAPQPLLAALSGLSAAAYLVLRHTTMTRSTAVGSVGFTAAGMLATAVPTGVSWLPLLAPVVVVLVFAVAIGPFFPDERADEAAAAEPPTPGYN